MTPLRHRMIEDMQARNLAPHTQTAYLQYVSQFARHFHKSPELLGPADIRAFQLYLANERGSSAETVGDSGRVYRATCVVVACDGRR